MRVITLCLSLLVLTSCATGSTKSDKGKKLTATERARLHVEIANSALYEGDPTGALESLMTAEADDPNLPELHHTKAIAYAAKKDPATALMEARKAVALKPDYTEANNTLGKLLVDAGRYAEARPFLVRASRDPLYREVYKPYTNLGLLELKSGNSTAARERFTQAIDSAPAVACVAYAYRGQIDLSRGHASEAIHDYERSTRKLCAGYVDGHLALANAYEKGKRYDMARKTLLDIQNRFPNTQVAEQAMSRLRYLP
jgi:Tfp pilus assembly protein PilF